MFNMVYKYLNNASDLLHAVKKKFFERFQTFDVMWKMSKHVGHDWNLHTQDYYGCI